MKLALLAFAWSTQIFFHTALISRLTEGLLSNANLLFAFIVSALLSALLSPLTRKVGLLGRFEFGILHLVLLVNLLLIYVPMSPWLFAIGALFCHILFSLIIASRLASKISFQMKYIIEGLSFSLSVLLAPFLLAKLGHEFLLFILLVCCVSKKRWSIFYPIIGLAALFYGLMISSHFQPCEQGAHAYMKHEFQKRFVSDLPLSENIECLTKYTGVESVRFMRERDRLNAAVVVDFNGRAFTLKHPQLSAQLLLFKPKPDDSFVVVGGGAGVEIEALKLAGVKNISTIEMNPAVCDFLRGLYEQNLTIYCQEAAELFKNSKERAKYYLLGYVDNNLWQIESNISPALKVISQQHLALLLEQAAPGGGIIVAEQDSSFSRQKLIKTLAALREISLELDITLVERSGLRHRRDYWLFAGKDVDIEDLDLCSSERKDCEIYSTKEGEGIKPLFENMLYKQSLNQAPYTVNKLVLTPGSYGVSAERIVWLVLICALAILLIPSLWARFTKNSALLRTHSSLYGLLVGYCQYAIFLRYFSTSSQPHLSYSLVVGGGGLMAYLLILLVFELHVKNKVYLYLITPFAVALTLTFSKGLDLLVLIILSQVFFRFYIENYSEDKAGRMFLFNLLGLALGSFLALLSYLYFGLEISSRISELALITLAACFLLHNLFKKNATYFEEKL